MDLFGAPAQRDAMGSHAWVLRGFALAFEDALLAAIAMVQAQAPFRHMHTPGGLRMSVAITNCGDLGWISDARGYRYSPTDPQTGQHWPAMAAPLRQLAQEAAHSAGFPDFKPDACLINCYQSGNRMSLHQDKNERNFGAPIVSVSLGVRAVFLFGGHARGDKTAHTTLEHGDVAVWGGPDRLRFHGVLPLQHGTHPLLGARRINLTFRQAG